MTSILWLVETSEWKYSDAFVSKTKDVFDCFSAVFQSALNFEHFQTNITLIGYVFPKLPTTKDVLI